MIREAKEYVDDDGRKITGYYPINEGSSDIKESSDIISLELPISPIFRGTIGIRTSAGVIPLEFIFPDNYTLAECFANFEKHADEMVEKIKQDAEEQNLIMTPDQVRKQAGIIS